VITNELEKANIPTVQICNMVPVANSVGVKRIFASTSVKYPLGAPSLPLAEEIDDRLIRTRKALENLR
jgi:glycine/betaine/sarcosine/D-proline reductase family selenoprotein B